MHNVFCFIGKSGSGKTTVAEELSQYGYKQLISYTTRKQRNPNDNSHIFVSQEEYDAIPSKDKCAEVCFDGNWYCATVKQLLNCDIYVVDPIGFQRLKTYVTDNKIPVRLHSVLFDVPTQICIQRMKIRGDSLDMIEQRVEHDKKVFEPDLKYRVNFAVNGTIMSVTQQLRMIMELFDA